MKSDHSRDQWLPKVSTRDHLINENTDNTLAIENSHLAAISRYYAQNY